MAMSLSQATDTVLHDVEAAVTIEAPKT